MHGSKMIVYFLIYHPEIFTIDSEHAIFCQLGMTTGAVTIVALCFLVQFLTVTTVMSLDP